MMNRLLPAPKSDINITPLVDVVLVLLVVFLISAPTLQQGLHVELPHTQGNSITESSLPIVLRVDAKQHIFLQDKEVPLAQLTQTVKLLLSGQPPNREREIQVQADQNLPYGLVMRVMSSAEAGGATSMTMLTQPL